MSHMSAEELRAKQEVERLRMEEMDEVTKEFPHFSRTKLEQMKRKFMEYDLDNSGDLDLFEVQKMMEKLGQPKTRAELVQLIAEVDTSNTGKISFREYLMAMSPPELRGESKEAPVSLFGRIAQSALADKARFFEEQIRKQQSKSEDQVRAEIRAEAAKRRLEKERQKEEEEERLRKEAEEKEREESRARMAARRAMFEKK